MHTTFRIATACLVLAASAASAQPAPTSTTGMTKQAHAAHTRHAHGKTTTVKKRSESDAAPANDQPR